MRARACIIPVFVPHLGCPHACVFCNQRRITGQLRPADGQTVRRVIEQAAALPQAGAERQLAFYGGSFTAIPAEQQEELLQAAHDALERGQIDSIRLSTRPDAVNEQVLARLRRFGVETVELGAQSMDDEVLRLSGRGHTAEDVARASGQIKAAGFKLILQMMTGLPGDTPDRCVETAKRIIRLQPDGVRIYPTVIVKDTQLYELWRQGKYREHRVEDAVSICARLLPLFEEAGIPVIRLGLNPTEELSGGAAVAGAYHPALGELVKSRILLNRARELLAGVLPGTRVVLGIGARRLSQLIGQKRENAESLRRDFALSELTFVPLEDPDAALQLLKVERGPTAPEREQVPSGKAHLPLD